PHACNIRNVTLFNFSTLVSRLLQVGHSTYSFKYIASSEVNSCGSFLPTKTALSPVYWAGVANSFDRYWRTFSGSLRRTLGNSAKFLKNVLFPCHIISTFGSSNLEVETFLVSDTLSCIFLSNFSYSLLVNSISLSKATYIDLLAKL